MCFHLQTDGSLFVGYVVPYCLETDPFSKRGVDCLIDGDVVDALNVHKVIHPELHRRAINFRCSDSNIKPHMTETEIVDFIMDNYALKVKIAYRVLYQSHLPEISGEQENYADFKI